jgi:phage anti-repressor protein
MNELIVIKKEKINDEEVNAVNARDLHEFLEIKKDFSEWIKAQIKRGRFVENRDFIMLTQKGEQNQRGGHNKIEYVFTI